MDLEAMLTRHRRANDLACVARLPVITYTEHSVPTDMEGVYVHATIPLEHEPSDTYHAAALNYEELANVKRLYDRVSTSLGGGDLLTRAVDKLGLTSGAAHTIERIAHAAAALANSDVAEAEHIAEALSYRRPDIDIANRKS